MSEARGHRVLYPVIAMVFLAIFLLVYMRALDSALLFDTKAALTHNPAVQIDGTDFDGWRSAAASFTGSPFGRPIAMISFAANHAVAGEFSSTQLRLTNVALHGGIAMLLFAFLSCLLGNSPVLNFDQHKARLIAGCAALIWLLHPLNVSTVFYVVQRMTQLSTLFTLLGLWVFSHYRGKWAAVAPTAGALLSITLWLLVITALSVLSKENGILLLWLLPTLEICFFDGLWGRKRFNWLVGLSWIALLAPLMLMATLLFFTDSMSYFEGYSTRAFNLGERVLTEGRVLWHYVAWLMVPDIQSMGLHHDDILHSTGVLRPVSTLFSLLAWIGSIALAGKYRKRFPIVFFCLLFFLIAHSLESSIFPLELAWEHRNYLPGTAVCLLLAWGLYEFSARLDHRSFAALSCVVLVVFALLLFVRTGRWTDELTFSRVNLTNHPQSLRSNYHYANALYRTYNEAADDQRDAEMLLASRHYYEVMHQLDPGDISALVSLYFLDEHYFPQLAEKVDWFHELEEAVPDRVFSSADFNALSLLTSCLGDGSCAMDFARVLALYDMIARRYPRNSRIWNLISQLHYEMRGDLELALGASNQAIAISPRYLNNYLQLLKFYDRQGDVGQVIMTLLEFLKHDPERRALYTVKPMLAGET